jgi:UDP-N-acetylglucosamine acyltransferase
MVDFDPDYINTDGNWIHKTALINRDFVEIGTGNVIGPYCVIGSNGEMRGKAPDGFKGKVIIGDNNRISELVTIQRPYYKNEITYIANDNIIMAHCHIGHHATMGSGCELGTGTIVGGHTHIHNGAMIKLGVTLRNRIVIGQDAIVGMGSVVVKDVLRFTTVMGNPAKLKL